MEGRTKEELQDDINRLKDPTPYQEKFENKETQQLTQAIDILNDLKHNAALDSSRIGYEKLRNAQAYLDGLLKSHVDAEK